MFDTFLVKDNIECQTKDLDCVLDVYSLGDTVPSLEAMSDYYIIAGHGNDKHGIIVIDNIYLAYCEPDKVKEVFSTFSSMPNVALQTLSGIVKKRLNVKLFEAQSKLYQIISAIKDYEKFKAGPGTDDHQMYRILSRGFFERFEQGDDIVDIIKELLEKDSQVVQL
jgi:hypothetical protein